MALEENVLGWKKSTAYLIRMSRIVARVRGCKGTRHVLQQEQQIDCPAALGESLHQASCLMKTYGFGGPRKNTLE